MTESVRDLLCTVCVPTFRRPALLEALFEALETQSFPRMESASWQTLVIDNDPQQSARAPTEAAQSRGRLALRYVTEPRVGLTWSRNRALDEVGTTTPFLVFIDDDEMPIGTWLDSLLAMQREKNAVCVAGPVYARLPEKTPRWIKEGNYLDTPHFENGAVLPWIGAGNLLLATRFLQETGLHFDARFNRTGGEDTYFLKQAQKKYGLKIFGAANAVAYEATPPERLTLRWNWARRYRGGFHLGLCEPNAARFLKAPGWILRGLVEMPSVLWRGPQAGIEASMKIVFGLGILAGFLGVARLPTAYGDAA